MQQIEVNNIINTDKIVEHVVWKKGKEIFERMVMIANNAKTLRASNLRTVLKKMFNVLIWLLATQFAYRKDFEQQQRNKPKQSICINWKLKLHKVKWRIHHLLL